jgi:hypothetical protein
MTIFLKLTLGFIIGKTIGLYCAKNELSPVLGVCLTAVTVLLACALVDKALV